jgi:hypothetical protein
MFNKYDGWWQEQELDAEISKPKVEPAKSARPIIHRKVCYLIINIIIIQIN